MGFHHRGTLLWTGGGADFRPFVVPADMGSRQGPNNWENNQHGKWCFFTTVNRTGMGKKIIIVLWTISFVLTMIQFAEAREQSRVPKIGWLETRSMAASTISTPGRELFQRELRELGYIDGKNIAIEYRSAENKIDRLPALANELVHLNIDVLITGSTAATLAAKMQPKQSPSCF